MLCCFAMRVDVERPFGHPKSARYGCVHSIDPLKATALTASLYLNGSSLDKTVGRNSATVGWICVAR